MIREIAHALLRFAVVLTLVFGCSCGSGRRLYPVHGYVFVDGKPAVGARVMFHPVNDQPSVSGVIRPSGMVEADGSFQLGSSKPKDGAPAGEYRVTVDWLPPGFTRQQAHEFEAKQVNPDKLGGRYAKAQTSGLRATVTAGVNELEAFQLKP
jgi:hypothetical protein